MTVFKTYLKIALFNKVTILVYAGIFMAFSIFIANIGSADTEFREVRPNVVIFNESDSLLSEIFIKYIEDNAEMVDVEKDNVEDALFFRTVDYAIYIDEDFEETKEISTRGIPDSFREAYLEILINRFLNIVDTYENAGLDIEFISETIFEDLDTDVAVNLDADVEPVSELINAYYNFSNYIVLSLNIFLVSLIVKTFKDEPILKRNLISKVSNRKMNGMIFLGNLIISGLIFLFISLIAFAIFKEDLMNISGLLVSLNLFVMSIASMNLGFLIGNFIDSKEGRNGIVNVVGLGSSFISGAFVPQAILSSSVLLIARFFPSYYFINTNDKIFQLSQIDSQIYVNMGIILAFGLLFYILNNLFSKTKID